LIARLPQRIYSQAKFYSAAKIVARSLAKLAAEIGLYAIVARCTLLAQTKLLNNPIASAQLPLSLLPMAFPLSS
jgi:hypothetical protein